MNSKINYWRKEEIDLLKKLLSERKTLNKITKETGRPIGSIRDFIDRHKKDYLTNTDTIFSSENDLPKELIDKTIYLLKLGYSTFDTCLFVKLPEQWVIDIKNKYNIQIPTLEEMAYKGYLRVSINEDERMIIKETGLTKRKMINLLKKDISLNKISQIYGLGISTVIWYARTLLKWETKEIQIRRKVYSLLGKEINEDLLKKKYKDVISKEELLSVLEKNNYLITDSSRYLGITEAIFNTIMRSVGLELTEEQKQIGLSKNKEKTSQGKRNGEGGRFPKKLKKYFPNLEIISKYTGSDDPITVRCKIHNEIIITTPSNLIYNHTRVDKEGNRVIKSNPCSSCRRDQFEKEMLDGYIQQISEKFPGKFDFSKTTLERSLMTSGQYRNILSNVKCNKCGEYFSADVYYLRNHGLCAKCESISHGEAFTSRALDELNIPYKRWELNTDAVPKEIRSKGIYIDFVIENYKGKIVWIEYNGLQHYKYSPKYHKDIERSKSNLSRDQYERQYCLERKDQIMFLEIPYTFDTYEKVFDLLERVLINDENIEDIIDYKPFYKSIEKLSKKLNELS